MNFKALALSAALGLSTIFGVAAPAEAKVSRCWVLEPGQAQTPPFRCEVNRRINHNGHIVFDIRHFRGNGAYFSVVMWTDGTAELFMNGERFVTRVVTDNEGDHWLDLFEHGHFIFRT